MNRIELEQHNENIRRVEGFEILFGLLLHCRTLQDAIIWLIHRLFG